MNVPYHEACPICGKSGFEHTLKIAQQINDHQLNTCPNLEKNPEHGQTNMQRNTQSPQT